MKKRFLMRAQAFAMAVCLTVGALNATAFAAQQTDSNQTQQTTEDNTAKDNENDASGSGTSDSTTEGKDNNEDKKDEGTDSDTGNSTDDESSGSESGDSTDETGGQENPDNGSTDTGTEGGSADNGTDNNLDDKNSTDSEDKVSDTDKTEEDSKTDDKDKDKKEDDKKEKKAKEEELPESGPVSYHRIEYDVKSVDGNGELSQYRTNLSLSYDSRDSGCITSVRNQNPYGTCWAFSAMAASEAAIIKGGLADSPLDLSEFHTIYFTYNTVAEPLGNTEGDRLEAADSINGGGNNMLTSFSLATWAGVTGESKAPYSVLVSNSSAGLDSSLAYDDDYHLQNSYWISMKDSDDVKSAIVKYGAVAAAYNHDDEYLNAASFAYCAPASLKTGGHAIALIGWDDNYSKENFNSNCQPSSDGAWLVKNSWDSWWGNDGYFWISYEDGNINKEPAIVFEYDSVSNYDHNYQYDGTPGVMAYGVYNSGSIANVFTAKANPNGSEKLEAVSFAMSDTNVQYSIQVYTDIKDSNDPTSGIKMLTTPQTGSTSYEGYYTVKLDTPVTLAEGSKFSVVISLSKSNSNTVYYFAEKSFDYGWIKGISSYNEGQSFTQMSSGQDWTDLADQGLTARIKAFTTDAEATIIQPAKVELNINSLSLKAGETSVLTATITPSNAANKDIKWESSNKSVAEVDTSGKVTAKGEGSATITATTCNGLSAVCNVTVTKEEADILPKNVKLNKSSIALKVGNTSVLAATITPSNAANKDIKWESSNKSVAEVDTSGKVTAKGEGSATITATTCNGLSAVCNVTVTKEEADILPENVKLNKSSIALKVGNTSVLTATITPSNAANKDIKWESGNKSVAEVDTSGKVTAKGEGSATITATTCNGLSVVCNVTVTKEAADILPKSVKLNKNSLSLKAGSTSVLTAAIAPSNTANKEIAWKSSKTSVASVDSKGKVTAKGLGTATITATAHNGVSAECKVTVTIGKVAGLKAASQSTSSIKLRWNKQNGASGYEIYRYDSSKKKYVKIKTITKASTATYTDTKRRSGTSYKYKVRAYVKNGSKKTYGSYSSVLTTATKTSRPTIKVTAGTKKAVVKWSKVSGATGYEVYMSTKKSSDYAKVKTLSKGSNVSYTKSGLKKGKTYYFKVRAYKKAGDKKIYSSYSSVKSVKIKK